MSDLGLHIKQSQAMVMTPQMQQAIKLLQLSALELTPYVAQQVEENPFLETAEEETAPGENPAMDPQEEGQVLEVWNDEQVSPAIYDTDTAIYSGASSGSNNHFNESDYGIEDISSGQVGLKEHVLDQVQLSIGDPVMRVIALHLTDLLEDTGYLTADLAPLCNVLQCSMEDIERVVMRLQGFDPVGVFARNLAECLTLQLKEKDRFDPAMQVFMQHLDLYAKRDFKALQKLCRVDEEDLMQMCQEIQALNPKPGNVFSGEQVQVLCPDIFLKRDQKGKWSIELNNDVLPKVLVNRRYYAEVEGKTKDKQSKKFLVEQYQQANWLVKALDQRAKTILKVATELVAQQDHFFRYGIHYLRPLVLSDIAQSIQMHESTVSRVINGKYMATHMGLYELKYFFSSSVASTDGGEDVSSKTIKFMIKDLIEKEAAAEVLSDDKITAILKEKGINVARRTVMKYREAMGIGSSVQRRREKGLGG